MQLPDRGILRRQPPAIGAARSVLVHRPQQHPAVGIPYAVIPLRSLQIQFQLQHGTAEIVVGQIHPHTVAALVGIRPVGVQRLLRFAGIVAAQPRKVRSIIGDLHHIVPHLLHLLRHCVQLGQQGGFVRHQRQRLLPRGGKQLQAVLTVDDSLREMVIRRRAHPIARDLHHIVDHPHLRQPHGVGVCHFVRHHAVAQPHGQNDALHLRPIHQPAVVICRTVQRNGQLQMAVLHRHLIRADIPTVVVFVVGFGVAAVDFQLRVAFFILDIHRPQLHRQAVPRRVGGLRGIGGGQINRYFQTQIFPSGIVGFHIHAVLALACPVGIKRIAVQQIVRVGVIFPLEFGKAHQFIGRDGFGFLIGDSTPSGQQACQPGQHRYASFDFFHTPVPPTRPKGVHILSSYETRPDLSTTDPVLL